MSCHTHKTEALSPYTRESGTGGPTGTFTTQRQFARRLRGVLSRINARIREAIEERDLFNLRDEALVDEPSEDIFEFETTQRKVRGFLEWLRQQLDENYLQVVGPDRNQFIQAAYATGLREAQSNLSEFDVAFDRPDVDNLLDRPIHRTALQTLYTRVYENLVSVRDDVAQDVRDELVEGLREGKGPRDIARSLNDRVNSIGLHRSTLIARSEIMNAWSTSYLNRVEEVSQDADVDVGVSHSEWMTAEDSRVCPICRPLNGRVFTIDEMRNETFSIGEQTFRLRPPAHIQCRCSMSVVVGFDRADLDPLNERLPSDQEVQALRE